MNLESFHAWLRSACPAREGTLLAELAIGHRAQPEAYRGLPANSVELSRAMRQLEIAGKVEKREGEWFWKPEPVKAEPQKELFA